MSPPLCLPQLPLAERSLEEKLASLPKAARDAWLAEQPTQVLNDIRKGEWWWKRRAKQTEPSGDWLVWIIGSGRGWGKNRVGAETLVGWVEKYPADRAGNRTEWMVVAETLKDCWDLNFAGPSGLFNVLKRKGYRELQRPPKEGDKRRGYTYVKGPKPSITLYPHRQIIHGESADDEDVGRGYNLAGLWLDELAKWPASRSHNAWYDGLLPALRADLPAGGSPRCIVTTTPKPIGLLKQWYAYAKSGNSEYRLTIGSTYENAANLAPHTLAALMRELEGTRKGRQELHGELLDEVDGALWTRQVIEDFRVWELPPLVRVAVGVDPTGTGTGDEMGLVIIGADANDEQYVLSDLSRKLAGLPAARHAWKALLGAAHWLVDPTHRTPYMVVEEDYAKDWLKDVLSIVYKTMQNEGMFKKNDRPPIKFVKASLLGGKGLRAEPVAMRYELGRIHHYRVLHGLEDQMCTWDESDPKAHSPDRVDALVHASLWLRDQEKRKVVISDAMDKATLPVTRLTPG